MVIPLLPAFLTGATFAAETGLTGGEGHPRGRFPLAIYTASLGESALDAAAATVVEDWNALAQDVLGVRVFARVERTEDAQVVVAFQDGTPAGAMGSAHVRAEADGVIVLPVRVSVAGPHARGQVSRETVLYQVLAHELGHALGLGHTTDPRSLMCCVAGRVDFGDPVVREAYVEARRHPDVRSVRMQLAAHYARFWSREGR